METTTDLDKLKKGAKFTWGEVRSIHEVRDYGAVEYQAPESREGGGIYYTSYLNGQALGHSFLTLEEALLDAIVFKQEGLNSQAGMYFCRSIGIIK